MSSHKLSHITDLANLSDAEAAQFAAELPTLVAALRLAQRGAEELGMELKAQFPVITFDTNLGDEVVLRGGGKTIAVDGVTMRQAEKLDASAAIETAKAVARAKNRP